MSLSISGTPAFAAKNDNSTTINQKNDEQGNNKDSNPNKDEYTDSRNKNEKHPAKVDDKKNNRPDNIKNHDHKQCKENHPEDPEEVQTIFNRIVVFNDTNRNGIYDQGEQLLSDAKLEFNNVNNPGVAPIQQAYSDANGQVKFIFPGELTTLTDFYLRIVEMPAGYQISPEPNSLFGLDNNTRWCDLVVENHEIVFFGGQSMVYVPLIKSNTTTMEVATANWADHSIVYQGVAYDLYQLQMNTEFVKIDSQVSDENGICTFNNVSTEFDVYIRATNLNELGLQPYEFVGQDGNSGFIKLTAPKTELLVTVSEIQ